MNIASAIIAFVLLLASAVAWFFFLMLALNGFSERDAMPAMIFFAVWTLVVYTVILVATTLVPSFIGMSGALYTAVAVVTGAAFLYLSVRLYRAHDAAMKKVARSVFTFSLSYLFVIFLALMTDRVAQVAGWL